MSTTPADLAPFTTDDLEEARSRLVRLALIWQIRLRSLTDAELDAPAGDAWTLRHVALDVTESAFYADSGRIHAPAAGLLAAELVVGAT